MKVRNVFWVAVVLVTLSGEAVAQSKTIFSGLPSVLTSESGFERNYEVLTKDTATDRVCVISKIGSQYYWASRENKQLIRSQSGVFTTFVAVDGSGYIRVAPREYPDARDPVTGESLLTPSETTFDYMEHMLIGLRSITYYGTVVRAPRRVANLPKPRAKK